MSNNNRYDDEFKASAVKMVIEKGRPISAVSHETVSEKQRMTQKQLSGKAG